MQDCGDPTPVNGKASTPFSTTFGETVMISCNPGYNRNGSSSLTCQHTGWSDTPTCDIQDCGDPSPENGTANALTGTTYGETAVIICDNGYILQGHEHIICTDGGYWSDNPTCLKVCEDPTPNNGSAYTPDGTTYGETAFISCDDGYILQGEEHITCKDGATWSSFRLVCEDPTPNNGSAYTPDGTTYGETAFISCDDGYILQGEEHITCEDGATWSVNSTCLRVFQSDCGDPTPVNGRTSTPFSTTFGETVTISCNPGYNLTGSSFLTCQHIGWSDTPTCDIKDCGDPSPENGTANVLSGTTYGETAIIICDNGYILLGDEHIICTDGGYWSDNPTCLKDCGDPTPINGKTSTPFGTTFDETVTVYCNPGYNLTGSTNLTCQHTGWSDTPTCNIQVCEDPTPDNGSAYTPDGTTFGETAFISCEDGYILQGEEHITCEDGATWSVNSTCLRDCGDPTPINGKTSISFGTTFDETVTVYCNPGYNLTGSTYLTCQHTGWSDTPTCNIQVCEDPTPDNGSAYTPDGTTFGETAFISCEDGYILQGEEHITCEDGATWSVNSTCLRDCGDPTPINGKTSIPFGTTFDETVTVYCNPGYNLTGSTNLTCQHTGWSDTPTCDIKDCGDPTPDNGSAYTPGGTTYGETAFISCDEGYILQGEEHITCEDGETWSVNSTCLRGIVTLLKANNNNIY
ncbi:CUB and sushi domain-containing protein 3-like [Mercenaria mercenaria]|uniref:CUB and sushi domain-containing protein 3-like n=1 Tax=Mercenaria mercenaria TaxID=6596 RepID=UPI00234E621A|nr:CUB and sushi domain-containing protein 3-like [Mercenaria mercenaria]